MISRMNNQKPIHQIIVRVALRNSQGRLLVLQKSDSSDRAGAWEFAGGHMEEGESLDQAAIREVLEETGIKVKKKKLKYMSSNWYTFKNQQRFGVLFVCDTAYDKVILSSEHKEFDWIDSSNSDNIRFADIYQSYFKKLFIKEGDNSRTDVDNSTVSAKLKVYTDGGSRGNPGPSATGYVLINEDEEVIDEGGEYIGITTNNQAEYQAVKLALKRAREYPAVKELDFFIDSLLVVNQMNGVFKIRNKDLWPIHEAIKKLASEFDRVSFTHVKREFNKLADAKVNQALDDYSHANR